MSSSGSNTCLRSGVLTRGPLFALFFKMGCFNAVFCSHCRYRFSEWGADTWSFVRFADIGLEDEGSTGGAASWNQQFRSLTFRLYADHGWAYKNTNSSFAVPFWGPSGAALFNMALWSNVMGTWIFNEVRQIRPNPLCSTPTPTPTALPCLPFFFVEAFLWVARAYSCYLRPPRVMERGALTHKLSIEGSGERSIGFL